MNGMKFGMIWKVHTLIYVMSGDMLYMSGEIL